MSAHAVVLQGTGERTRDQGSEDQVLQSTVAGRAVSGPVLQSTVAGRGVLGTLGRRGRDRGVSPSI